MLVRLGLVEQRHKAVLEVLCVFHAKPTSDST
jgi:hypothetical protein